MYCMNRNVALKRPQPPLQRPQNFWP